MTAVDVDALDKLREAATAGPWGLDFNEWMDGSRVVAMDDDSEDDGITPEIAWNDAAYIVAAVNALPDLLAEVRRGRARDEVLKNLIVAAPVVWNGDYPVKAVPVSDLLSLDALADALRASNGEGTTT